MRGNPQILCRHGRKEKSKLDVLYKAATDLHRSTQERIKAIKQLQSIYPKIFSSYTNEEIMLGKACAAYETLRKQIIATAQAKAYEDKITDFESKKYGALVKRQNQYVSSNRNIRQKLLLQKLLAKTLLF